MDKCALKMEKTHKIKQKQQKMRVIHHWTEYP